MNKRSYNLKKYKKHTCKCKCTTLTPRPVIFVNMLTFSHTRYNFNAHDE